MRAPWQRRCSLRSRSQPRTSGAVKAKGQAARSVVASRPTTVSAATQTCGGTCTPTQTTASRCGTSTPAHGSATRCASPCSLNTLCARATCPHSRQCEMCSADAQSRLTLVPAAVLNATQSCSTVPGTIKRFENPRKGLPIATAGLQDRLRAGQPGPHGQGGVLRAPVQHASEMVNADAPRNPPLDASLLCCVHPFMCTTDLHSVALPAKLLPSKDTSVPVTLTTVTVLCRSDHAGVLLGAFHRRFTGRHAAVSVLPACRHLGSGKHLWRRGACNSSTVAKSHCSNEI